jgi:hypothetical protein
MFKGLYVFILGTLKGLLHVCIFIQALCVSC